MTQKKIIAWILLLFIPVMLSGCDGSDYKKAASFYDSGDFEAAIEIFTELGDYKDSQERLVDCRFHYGQQLYDHGDFEAAIEIFAELGDYKDSQERLADCRFDYGKELYDSENYAAARKQFQNTDPSEEADQYLRLCAWGILREYFAREGSIKKYDSQYDVEKSVQIESNCSIQKQGKDVIATIESTEIVSYPILSTNITTVTNTTVTFDGKQIQSELEAKADVTVKGPKASSSFQNVGSCLWDIASYTADTPVIWDEFYHIGTDGKMHSDGDSAPAFNKRVATQQAILVSCLKELLADAELDLTIADLGFLSEG